MKPENKRDKVERNTEDLMFKEYSELKDMILSNRNIPEEEYSTLRDKIQKLDKQFEIRKRETKGAIVFFIIISSIFIALFVFAMTYYDKAKSLEWDAKMLGEFMKIEHDSINNRRTIHYQSKDGKNLTYYDLSNSVDSLQSDMIKKNSTIDSLIYEIRLIRSRYNINVTYIKKDKSTAISVKSPKIDSALILLDVYRDKLKYDAINRNWIIGD